MSTYAFENAWHQARRRLSLLETNLDPATFRRIQALGLTEGWQCLDIGAGAGTVASWLCAHVGSTGRVIATDIDTRFLDALTGPNLEVRRHNIAVDNLPEASFDLVHTRLVLMHLPARAQILTRLVAALKPGGWLFLEEHDIFPVTAAASGPYAEVWAAFIRAVASAGCAVDWARQLPQTLARCGLQAVGQRQMCHCSVAHRRWLSSGS
jgi:2-polyprenyl-3-methyl-5-hydroxy-6-metoxy-1,4-benzoquinol methylase